MSQNNINTQIIQQFLNQVRAADASRQREVKLDITTAKQLSHTLALAMTRLAGDYEGLISNMQKEETVVSVAMDGGGWQNNN